MTKLLPKYAVFSIPGIKSVTRQNFLLYEIEP